MTLISDSHFYTYTLGKYINGIWTVSAPIEGSFDGSIQPLNFQDINSLPVGREDTGKIKIYSDTPLPMAREIKEGEEETEVPSNALVRWLNLIWEVTEGNPYQMGIIPHYKYTAEYRGELEE